MYLPIVIQYMNWNAFRYDHFQRNILFSIMTSLDFQLLTNVTSSHQVCSRGLSKKIDAF